LEKNGAGNEIQTHDFNLGKVTERPFRAAFMLAGNKRIESEKV